MSSSLVQRVQCQLVTNGATAGAGNGDSTTAAAQNPVCIPCAPANIDVEGNSRLAGNVDEYTSVDPTQLQVC